VVFAPKKEPFPVFPHHQHETVTKTSTLPHGQKKTRDNNKEKKTKKKKKFSHSSHDTQVRSENKKKKKFSYTSRHEIFSIIHIIPQCVQTKRISQYCGITFPEYME